MKIEAAVICGDGVGPEMMGAALSALKAVCKKYHHELVTYPVCACSEALELGKEPLPEESLQQWSGGSGSAVWQYRIGKIPG